MARTKSFSSMNAAKPEPLEFVLNERTWHCIPNLPGAVLLDFTAKAGAGEENPGALAEALLDLLTTAVVPEEAEAFGKFLRDPANDITMDILTELVEYLTEQYLGGVPLEHGEPSPAG